MRAHRSIRLGLATIMPMLAVTVLQIHPIKALDPVRVTETRILSSGALELDRRWALVDRHGRFVNGKNRVGVHRIRAVYDLGRLEVALDGRTYSLERQGAEIAVWFSERLNLPVELRENAEMGFPDDTASPGPTLVSEASLALATGWFNFPIEQTRLRFRTNIEFDGVEALWEDRLYGSSFRVGSVQIHAINPCQRCVVPSRDPLTGLQDNGFPKRFSELRRAHLPTWADAAFFDHHYRLGVNTRVFPSESGKMIHVGETLTVP